MSSSNMTTHTGPPHNAPKNCPICTERMRSTDRVVVHYQCGSAWHQGCIREWLNSARNQECPSCRGSLGDEHAGSGSTRSTSRDHRSSHAPSHSGSRSHAGRSTTTTTTTTTTTGASESRSSRHGDSHRSSRMSSSGTRHNDHESGFLGGGSSSRDRGLSSMFSSFGGGSGASSSQSATRHERPRTHSRTTQPESQHHRSSTRRESTVNPFSNFGSMMSAALPSVSSSRNSQRESHRDSGHRSSSSRRDVVHRSTSGLDGGRSVRVNNMDEMRRAVQSGQNGAWHAEFSDGDSDENSSWRTSTRTEFYRNFGR